MDKTTQARIKRNIKKIQQFGMVLRKSLIKDYPDLYSDVKREEAKTALLFLMIHPRKRGDRHQKVKA